MKKKYILVLFFFTLQGVNCQGLNNNYNIDSTDIKNTFELLNIKIFKFPLLSKKQSYSINYIIDEYINGNKKSSINFKQELAKQNFPSFVIDGLLSKIKKKNGWLRLYFLNNEENTILRIVSEKGKNTEYILDYIKEYRYDYRAYDFDKNNIPFNKKIPLVVRYGKKQTSNLEHCPGNASLKELKKLYEHLFIIYLEISYDRNN